MAGESPDKVERRESSGETTEDRGGVASTDGEKTGVKRERNSRTTRHDARSDAEDASGEARPDASDGDARPASEAHGDDGDDGDETEAESVGRAADDGGGEEPEDAGPGGGTGSGDEREGQRHDRLKAAVAAWVAGADDEPGGAGSDDAERAGGDGVKDGKPNSRAGEKNSSQIAESGASGGTEAADSSGEPGGEKPPEGSDGAGSAAATAGVVDHPTAMFRTVRPGADDSAAATDAEEAARRAERMTAAFFGTPASAKSAQEAEGSEDSAEGGDRDADEDPSEGAGESAAEGAQEGADAGREDEPAAQAGGGSADASGGSTEAEGAGGDGERPDAGAGVGAGSESEEHDEKQPAERASVEGGQSAERTSGDKPSEDKPSEDKAPKARAGEESGARDEKQAEPREKPGGEPGGPTGGGTGAGPVDDATKVFRAPTADELADRAAKDGDSGGEPAVDQPTTAFRTPDRPRRDAKAARAKDSDAKSSDAKDADARDADARDADAKPAKDSAPADPRVTAAEPGTEAKPGAGKKGAKPGAGKKPEAGTESDAESADESDSERTSQFVPLRSADVPPRPKRAPTSLVPPAPGEEPAPGALPPEAEPQRQLSEAELTRQQVRPDQAPLDLLAQLTNTPPPPETPLRILVRRVKIWTPLVVLLVILFAVAQAVRPLPGPELSLSASPTYSFQGSTPSVPWPSEGQAALEVQGLGSLGTYGKQKPVPIASVAKVMTAYVILRDHPVRKGSEGPKIPVDKKAESEAGLSAQNESTVEVKEGDKLSEREAIQAVMIASANNVARLLARWDAGSEKAFAKKMNAAARDLGMKNTKYTDPSGLTSSTVSTATDQVKLAKKAMGIDLFRETVRLPGYTDAKGDEHGNWNKLVPLDGVVGIKTGTTTKAGGNLLFAAEKKVGGTEQLIVGAVLGQYRPSILDTVLDASHKLIDTAQDSLRAQKVVRKGEVVGYVDDQLGGRTPVVASRDVSAVGWSGLKVKLGLTDGGRPLPHEGKAGDRAGTLTVGDGPGQVRVPVKLKEDMTAPGFGAKLTRIL